MPRVFLLVLIICAVSESAVAQSNSGTIFRFLEVAPTARTAALGGNHVGLYDADFSLIHINPAYLRKGASGSVSASFMNFLGGANMGFTSGAYHIENVGTFAAGIRFLSYGEFDELNEDGEQLGTFNANDMALTGSYSLLLGSHIQLGSSFDVIHSSYATYKSTALAISGGVFYQDTSSHFSAGLSIRNLGGQLTAFDTRREPLPLDVSIGITKKPEAFPFQLSLTLARLNDWDLRVLGETQRPDLLDNAFRHVVFGGEATLGENLIFRFGYDHYLHEQVKTNNNFDLAGISLGLGFNIQGITFDFSRNSYSKLGGLTRLSIKTKLF
ncbi:MAG: type IX secretion system protein PorQ [Gracilimonas sp.]|jgi:hypothetical protein|nr:type IX secretion system protein PorQ [Gracilimonas sp.]